MLDGRCRFGPRAKREMVARVLAGEHARAIARSMRCSPSTVTAARDRWLAASEAERSSGVWCAPRRPVPGSCPWALSAEAEQAILDARAKSNWGPMRLTWLTGRHRSTIWKVLKRHGVSRQRRRAPVATSGPRPGRCCISTRSSCRSSTGRGIGRTAIAPSPTRPAARARSR